MIFDGCGVKSKNACFARHFDLLHNSSLTVPMYADRLELLVFGASLTSDSLSKKSFLTDSRSQWKGFHWERSLCELYFAIYKLYIPL